MGKKKTTTEEFIERARKVHGDKYDYSKVEYINSRTKVCIICPEHGEFWQEANSHLKGCGCLKCSKEKKNYYNDMESFIKDSYKLHGNKYDYSKVNFKKKNDKIKIICPIHGEFITTPHIHLLGCECPKCAGTKKLTTEEFIERARKVHGDKYDYSKVEYVNNSIKVCIICPEHGEFWQTPDCHMHKQGCPKCAGTKKLTTEEFIERARKIHGDKYDYSKVEYVNSKTKVCIICPVHGEFWMTPNMHLYGQECPKCSYSIMGMNRRLTTEEFIERARKIHGDKYDYSKVDYKGLYKSVCIICHKKDKHGKEHGEFWQAPANHLNGNKCPKCKESKLERKVRLSLDENNIMYIYQASKRDLNWLGLQSLDFYLPDYNVAIECQGEQHFKPVDFGGKGKEWAETSYEENVRRDEYKQKLCIENGITLLYYSNIISNCVYNNINKLIEWIIKRKI